MSLFTDGFAQINLGETLMGTDEGIQSGSPFNINVRMEGREAFVSHENVLNNAGVTISPGTGARTLVRVVRNSSGVVLFPGEIVKIDPAAGLVGFGRITAKASANDRLCYVVDPTLPAAGVAIGDLFLVCVRGPARVLAPAAGVALASAGLPLSAGASGRAAVTATTAATSRTVLGTFMTGIQLAAANENALLPCVLHPAWD